MTKWLVESDSEEGKFWEVDITDDVSTDDCECPPFIYKRKRPCKHIIKVREQMLLEQRKEDELECFLTR